VRDNTPFVLLLLFLAMDVLEVPAPADFHVHLRQPPFSSLIVPHVRRGGFALAYVMVGPPPPPAHP
jgi:dihydroorotase